jgi:Uma2 family endonuclease
MLKRKPTTRFTAEQYLALEEHSETKHEFYNGMIYDMAGGSADHSLLQIRLGRMLDSQLENTPCRVFSSDMRVMSAESELYTYPDLSVVCGKIQFSPKSKTTITNPILIVEILSESTRADDRGDKFNFYKQLPALEEYVLVESERAHVEVFHRSSQAEWTIEMFDGLDAIAALHSVRCEIPLNQLYAKVSWLD